MRLHEFNINIEKKILSLDKTDPSEFIDKLVNMGFKLEGGGYFSEVYSLGEGNRVIKVSLKPDPAYEKFLDISLNNTSNPHLPKVHWKIPLRFKDTDKPGFITTIEKLEDISDVLSSTSFETIANKLGTDTAMILIYATDTIPGVSACNYGMRHFETEGWLADARKNSKKIKSSLLYITLKKISELGKKRGVSQVDMHHQNLMLRKQTNTVVITDPWAF